MTEIETELYEALAQAVAYVERCCDAETFRRGGADLASVAIARHSADIGVVFDLDKARAALRKGEAMKRSKRDRREQGRWAPLQPADPVKPTEEKMRAMIAEALRIKGDADPARVREAIMESIAGRWWKNDLYTVIEKEWTPMVINGKQVPIVWLSIRRNDRSPARDWRHFQRIKNEIIGPECEAIELYPAESRLTDSANQYHLWALRDPEERFPFGFFEGRVVFGPEGARAIGAEQRPFDEAPQ
jgi:hypothetical protein